MNYNGTTIKDEESNKWGYIIFSSHYQDFDKSKIEKKVSKEFNTEDEAQIELDKEILKILAM